MFLTNNSSATVSDYVDKLARHGIEAPPEDICSSAQAAAQWCGEHLPASARIFVCAGPGVVEAFGAAGFDVVDRPPAAAVVVGFTRAFNFELLATSADLIRGGARFVATNADPTYPIPGGFLPGAGSLVAAVSAAAGQTPIVCGKPELPTVALVRARFGNVGIMVGDRPSTDGALADALGWPFALVLSGVAGAPGEEAIPDPPPPYVAADLAALVPMLLGG